MFLIKRDPTTVVVIGPRSHHHHRIEVFPIPIHQRALSPNHTELACSPSLPSAARGHKTSNKMTNCGFLCPDL